jgi:hypothetical protein
MRNNLDDVIRKNISKVNHISQIYPLLKNFKFKPAVATPSHAALPSFSTPGFGKFRPTRTREVVSISSDSNPSSPRSSKRTSSDTSLTFDPSPQSSKRFKRECLSEKENLFQPVLNKGKAKAPYSPSAVIRAECIYDEPWKKSALELERNPWAKLDRDFPSHCLPGPSSDGLVVPDCDSDLLSVRYLLFDLDTPVYVYLIIERH